MESGFTLLPPRGMRDLVGGDAEILEYLFNEFKNYARIHGFRPVIPPTIEYFKLFEKKSGEEIKRSMYVFKDKAGRLLSLRPEITASIVRIYLRLLRSVPKPVKLYYVAQCFRYEEPQHGRYREFWQAGLEVIGVKGVEADLEAALAASSFLDKIGVKHLYEVSNVSLHRSIMDGFGIPVDVQDHILHLIDKRMNKEAIDELRKISDEAAEAMEKLIRLRLDEVEGFMDEYSAVLKNHYDRLREELDRTIKFIQVLREMGYEAIYNPNLVRGLAYYSGLIFEYKAVGGIGLSIGGGGRYDGLTTVYGGPFEYSTGLALGLDRIALSLKGVKPPSKPRVMIIILDYAILNYAFKIKKSIEDTGSEITLYYHNKVRKALSTASKKGYDIAVIIGKKEYEENTVTVKDLRTGHQETVASNEVVKVLVENILRASS